MSLREFEGTPVYSFGFPLPDVEVEHVEQPGLSMYLAQTWICPRVTSAIISSRHEHLGPVQFEAPPDFYVFDKAFNYRNSGGPVVLQETGKAIAMVVRFQPVQIKQPGVEAWVMIPSLYGIGTSLAKINWTAVRDATAAAIPV